MSIRRDPVYLSFDVWRSLRLLAKAQTDEGHVVTVDQLADQMLEETIKTRHPKLLEYRKQIDKLEREMVKSLANGNNK